jgi:hypothetical protein
MADSRDVTVGWRFICVFCVALLVGACVRRDSSAQAGRVLAAYGAALDRGDLERAWGLLSPAERARVPLEAFRRQIAANPAEARELGRQLQRPRPLEVRAEGALDDGSPLGLVGTSEGFRLEDPLSRFYDQTSPRGALRSFVRAVERARWDVVERLLPARARDGMTTEQITAGLAARHEELKRIAARLSIAREQPIEVIGERATMPYAESFTARLVRQEGLWRVESPE